MQTGDRWCFSFQGQPQSKCTQWTYEIGDDVSIWQIVPATPAAHVAIDRAANSRQIIARNLLNTGYSRAIWWRYGRCSYICFPHLCCCRCVILADQSYSIRASIARRRNERKLPHIRCLCLAWCWWLFVVADFMMTCLRWKKKSAYAYISFGLNGTQQEIPNLCTAAFVNLRQSKIITTL